MCSGLSSIWILLLYFRVIEVLQISALKKPDTLKILLFLTLTVTDQIRRLFSSVFTAGLEHSLSSKTSKFWMAKNELQKHRYLDLPLIVARLQSSNEIQE